MNDNMLVRWYARWERWLLEPIDGRVHALVRISYGIVCLAIVIELWPLRTALFTEQGVSMLRADLPWYLPLKYARTTVSVSAVMIGAGLCALCLLFGLFTRFSLLVLWLWCFSYCMVGYPAESGYDAIGRLVGFVLLLGPVTRTWSLDARIFGPSDDTAARYPLRMLQVQLAILYVCTVWIKAPDPYWRNGELMAYFMMSMYSRVPSPEWAFWGRTSALMTWGTLLAEACIPLFLFNARLRRLGFLVGLLLHGGIALSSTIGMFSLSMLPLYAAFLRAEDVDAVQRLFTRWCRALGLNRAVGNESTSAAR